MLNVSHCLTSKGGMPILTPVVSMAGELEPVEQPLPNRNGKKLTLVSDFTAKSTMDVAFAPGSPARDCQYEENRNSDQNS